MFNFDQSVQNQSDQLDQKKSDFWVIDFDRILGTNGKWGKWSDTVAVTLPDIISWEQKLENILSMRVFEWLVILVGCKKKTCFCSLDITSKMWFR